jgi:hypothetical protein
MLGRVAIVRNPAIQRAYYIAAVEGVSVEPDVFWVKLAGRGTLVRVDGPKWVGWADEGLGV